MCVEVELHKLKNDEFMNSKIADTHIISHLIKDKNNKRSIHKITICEEIPRALPAMKEPAPYNKTVVDNVANK